MGSYLGAAGPLTWPILLLGLLAVVAAAWYAVRQGERPAAVARAATVGSLSCALVNALLGYQHSVSYLEDGAVLKPAMILRWVSESLNGVVVALAITLLVSLLFVIAGFRLAPRTHAS